MESITITTDSSNQVNGTSMPIHIQGSSLTADPSSLEGSRNEVNSLRIMEPLPATENGYTVLNTKRLELQRPGPDTTDNSDHSHCGPTLDRAFKAGLTIKDLRDRIASLEKSVEELRGAGKPDSDTQDVAYDLLTQCSKRQIGKHNY